MTFDRRKVASKILLDIRLWILASVLTHLTAITLPPLDPGVSWRETDVLMIARNFYEGNANIFYPVTDASEDKSGIVGCEFPIFNYLIYLLSVPFGYHDWFGRLINLIVSSMGVFCFYRAIKHYFGEQVAFCSGVVLLVSYWFLYSRLSLPDTFAASLNLIAIYAALRYFNTQRYYYLVVFFLCALFGCLSKISSSVLLTVLAIPFIFETPNTRVRILFVVCSVMIFLLTAAWYFLWVPQLSRTYGLGHRFFMGTSFSEGLNYLLNNWPATAKKFYQISMQYIGFVTFIAGLLWMLWAKRWKAVAIFAVPFVAYCIMFLKISYGFAINNYYVVMHLPMMAFVVGYFLGEMKRTLLTLLILSGIVIECVANQIHILNFRESKKPLLELESFVGRNTEVNERIAILGAEAGDPTHMYMAHRKGWIVGLPEVNPDTFRRLQATGCVYYVQVKSLQSDKVSLPILEESEHFVIYRLDSTHNFDPPVQ
jgi:hypothetical protein